MMKESGPLRGELLSQIKKLGSCDIVIGLATYNNANVVGHVVKALQTGVGRYFPTEKFILVNSDGGSVDGTRDVLSKEMNKPQSIQVSHRVTPDEKINTPYHGIPGKASAFRLILEIAAALNAKVCGFVDPDLKSISPECVDLLIRPLIKEGYEFVVPYYLRHKYDGTITSNIVYPMTRALYGKRVRQPLGGELSLTVSFARYLLEQKEIWEKDLARYGMDLWMVTSAISQHKKICESHMGVRVQQRKEPAVDLPTMLAQILGSVFGLMEDYGNFWKSQGRSETVAQIESEEEEMDLRPMQVSVDRMIHAYRIGVGEFLSLWEGVLSKEVLQSLSGLSTASGGKFFLEDRLWVRLIYEAALAVHQGKMATDHLLKSFTPLYLGRVASFILETQHSTHREVEEKIEGLCRAFEAEKGYLVERWNDQGEGGGEP